MRTKTLTRLTILLLIATGVFCSVWSAWLLFTDTNRVVSALIATVVALAVARPAITNLLRAFSVLCWKPGKLMESFLVWLTSPQVRPNTRGITLEVTRDAHDLLEGVVREGAFADRDAAMEALKHLPIHDEPVTRQQARSAQAALSQSPVVQAWKGLDELASSP